MINAVLLLVTSSITDTLEIDGFGSALLAAVVLSLASMLIGVVIAIVLPGGDDS